MSEASPSESAVATGGAHEAPIGIVAHYTAKGATIFWQAPATTDGLTNYNVEIASNGGAWKLISMVPATQLSLDITKSGTTGWCSFRISTVFADGQTVAGKVFGLPGQFA